MRAEDDGLFAVNPLGTAGVVENFDGFVVEIDEVGVGADEVAEVVGQEVLGEGVAVAAGGPAGGEAGGAGVVGDANGVGAVVEEEAVGDSGDGACIGGDGALDGGVFVGDAGGDDGGVAEAGLETDGDLVVLVGELVAPGGDGGVGDEEDGDGLKDGPLPAKPGKALRRRLKTM